MSDPTGKVSGAASSNPLGEAPKGAPRGDGDMPGFTTLDDLRNFLVSIGKEDLYDYFVQSQGMMISSAMQRSMRNMQKAMKEMKKSGQE